MLKAIWHYIIKPSLFLLVLTQICKALFLYQAKEYILEESFANLLAVFIGSLSLDFSVLSYIAILPVCFLSLLAFTRKSKSIHLSLVIYYSLVGTALLCINLIDIHLFSYWNSKTSAKAISYLNSLGMVISSAGVKNVVLLFILFALSALLCFYIMKKIIKKTTIANPSWIQVLFIFPLLLGSCILGIRGGLREIPINQSDAYFSDNIVLNIAGVNSLWNLGNVFFQNMNNLSENPYKTMSDDKAETLFHQLYEIEKDTTVTLFNIERPNIVYIAMEGVNANCIREFNEHNNYMPAVSKIMQEAYTFTNMYSSGMRTDQGLVSILSGFPALPLHTIGAQPEKFQALPSLSLALKAENYTNTFFFAGEPEFGSFKAFLVHNGFGKIYDLSDYTEAALSQDLGAPDEVLFNRFTKDMKAPQEPFFSLMLTQSTHEPFDMPFNDKVADDAQRYINTVMYLDSVLGVWYEECKLQSWFDHTIFILSSDHAHTFPERYWYTDKERYHIPFIIFGKPLKEVFKGKSNAQLVNQTDIPLSLAKQLNLTHQKFEFSKDILNPYSPEFSSFIHIHGHNWITKNGQCSVNYEIKNDFNKEVDSCLLDNAAYFQYAFQQYMRY
jgi:phosphoglycerol transferase MdoB-like AlkP superfamily enzyme